jgi:hypothetical protein
MGGPEGGLELSGSRMRLLGVGAVKCALGAGFPHGSNPRVGTTVPAGRGWERRTLLGRSPEQGPPERPAGSSRAHRRKQARQENSSRTASTGRPRTARSPRSTMGRCSSSGRSTRKVKISSSDRPSSFLMPAARASRVRRPSHGPIPAFSRGPATSLRKGDPRSSSPVRTPPPPRPGASAACGRWCRWASRTRPAIPRRAQVLLGSRRTWGDQRRGTLVGGLGSGSGPPGGPGWKSADKPLVQPLAPGTLLPFRCRCRATSGPGPVGRVYESSGSGSVPRSGASHGLR